MGLLGIMDAVSEWYEAHDSGDTGRVVAIFTPTGTYQDPNTDGPISGEAIGVYFQQRRGDVFADRVCRVVTSGAWSDIEAAAMFSASLRHIESGRVVTVDGAEFFTSEIESGKLSSVVAFYDPDQIRQQLE
jgi:hypothetical protein